MADRAHDARLGGGPGEGPRGVNLAVRLAPEALRHVRRGHPWVFDRSIASVRGGRNGDGTGEPGDVAVVFDDRRRFAAVGLWDPTSPIRIKVLHAGAPRPINRRLWDDRLAAAVDRRTSLASDPTTTAWRVLHGEDDAMPGLVVDRYGDVAVLKVYSPAWLPHLDSVLDVLEDRVGPSAVLLRLARSVQSAPLPAGISEGMTLRGIEPPERVGFRELGLRFTADVRRGQKTGWFLDQRDNRRRVGELAAGASVLDVFCCGGGFTVHAAAAGASQVHSVDLSPHAVAETARHLEMNRSIPAVRRLRHRGIVGDAFEVLAQLERGGEHYDVVVVDPPSFANRRADVAGALRAYSTLTDRAVRLVRPGGMLVQASCSSRVQGEDLERSMHSGAARSGRRLEVVRRSGQPVDHPVAIDERAYLCAVFARVGR